MPTESDSDVIFCLQLLSKTLKCTFNLSILESIDHLCINSIHRIGLIHKLSIDFKSLKILKKQNMTSLSLLAGRTVRYAKFACAYLKKNSEFDQEIPQSQTADPPMAPRGRATGFLQ